MQLTWIKNQNNNQWFDLLRLNLDAPYFQDKYGVYIVWYSGPSEARVIRIGQGHIGTRLKEHRVNPEITRYSYSGQLKVTWAIVIEEYRDGIEAFLFDSYKPLVGERSPDVQPIPVNLI
ncbi:MAG: hypothetical protein UW22_C0002G0008 [Candidatus Gottesmanbacteria bacterium GW2011_GWB1_44_11c]|uniref:GIY-YIG domain-containing protein n=2 Tax=Candidatus Gottesmaniibacteriota TaxID=1752720 RepID=A0A0G1LNN3_9BACT|nr:MAG: hypothetical protein UW22_C0002G0008 [Candidatus Gottesmanbacteria bacterium GW2011_GWB1_44_11c]KKT61494.1 MAG: hypothetical protein UW52_C0002G0008 [Candidatus Gottesmanbacteria bacterium GW2011_GWA1_44_24b]HCM81891.1 hypothetical protein [Patescibacteria group bacterium]